MPGLFFTETFHSRAAREKTSLDSASLFITSKPEEAGNWIDAHTDGVAVFDYHLLSRMRDNARSKEIPFVRKAYESGIAPVIAAQDMHMNSRTSEPMLEQNESLPHSPNPVALVKQVPVSAVMFMKPHDRLNFASNLEVILQHERYLAPIPFSRLPTDVKNLAVGIVGARGSKKSTITEMLKPAGIDYMGVKIPGVNAEPFYRTRGLREEEQHNTLLHGYSGLSEEDIRRVSDERGWYLLDVTPPEASTPPRQYMSVPWPSKDIAMIYPLGIEFESFFARSAELIPTRLFLLTASEEDLAYHRLRRQVSGKVVSGGEGEVLTKEFFETAKRELSGLFELGNRLKERTCIRNGKTVRAFSDEDIVYFSTSLYDRHNSSVRDDGFALNPNLLPLKGVSDVVEQTNLLLYCSRQLIRWMVDGINSGRTQEKSIQ